MFQNRGHEFPGPVLAVMAGLLQHQSADDVSEADPSSVDATTSIGRVLSRFPVLTGCYTIALTAEHPMQTGHPVRDLPLQQHLSRNVTADLNVARKSLVKGPLWSVKT